MHRHGYRGRKFGRERDQRNALMRGLTVALIEHQSIKTTLPKAKELRPMAEKLITKARKGGLQNRRAVIAELSNIEAANLLVDKIAPQIKRDSGYLRIVKLSDGSVGDNAEMAQIEFVDEIKLDTEPIVVSEKAEPAKPTTPKADKKGDK